MISETEAAALRGNMLHFARLAIEAIAEVEKLETTLANVRAALEAASREGK